MQQLVECVPNFSEGRDSAKINNITASIVAVPGITLFYFDLFRASHKECSLPPLPIIPTFM